MTLSLMDRDGRSTIASAEGQAALAAGNTVRAREKFAEAGSFLEEDIGNVRKQSEKHLLRFLAATQYFKGGEYAKALKLSQMIEQRLLPKNVRSLFPTFMKDVRSRASIGYESDVKSQLKASLSRKEYIQIIGLLQEHPFILPPETMAYLRGIACQELGNHRAALLFFEASRVNKEDGQRLLAELLPEQDHPVANGGCLSPAPQNHDEVHALKNQFMATENWELFTISLFNSRFGQRQWAKAFHLRGLKVLSTSRQEDLQEATRRRLARYFSLKARQYIDRGEDAFAGYIFTEMRKHLDFAWRDHFRRAARQDRLIFTGDSSQLDRLTSQRSITERLEELETAIQSLPTERDKQIAIAMMGGDAAAETARRLKISLSTYYSHRKTVLTHLRHALELDTPQPLTPPQESAASFRSSRRARG